MVFYCPDLSDTLREVITAASEELDIFGDNSLNPPEWARAEIVEFPGFTVGPWRRYVDPATANSWGIGTVRYPRTVTKDAECAAQLRRRTLTNLYNERPTWLDLAHKKLDAAVFAAYGWEPAMSDDDLLATLLALSLAK